MNKQQQDFYTNPEIPEGINTSPSHPLITFIKLFSAIAIILAVSAWLLGKSGDYLAALIPYSQEAYLISEYELLDNEHDERKTADIQLYLENLTAQISDAMDLPKEMEIFPHYVDDDIENAFATLGGHIFLYKGLLKKLPNENAISMVIAHEIAHIKHRDPIRSVGQSAAISAGFFFLLGYSETNLLGSAGLYTQLKFSRDMESASDTEGLAALVSLYGHANGATDLFKVLNALDDNKRIKEPTFFVTHPLGKNRIKKIQAQAAQHNWSMDKPVTALPYGFNQWLMQK
ncbi:MAG: M48 family metallopeptidase [Cocleimonas sp.]|nr:M48 family metallopeptidase [Cocleimonas sp.]